jgi:hypothetical protein
MLYILKVDSGTGFPTFASSEHTAKDIAAVRKAVRAAWGPGFATWAEGTDGSYIYGLNDRGVEKIPGRTTFGADYSLPKKKRVVLPSHRAKGKHRLRGIRGKAMASAGARRVAGITSYDRSLTTHRTFVTTADGQRWELTSYKRGPVEVYRIGEDGSAEYLGKSVDLRPSARTSQLKRAWLLINPGAADRASWDLARFAFENEGK